MPAPRPRASAEPETSPDEPLDSFERAELDTLRVENDTLRRKLKELDARLEAGIERAVAAATASAEANADKQGGGSVAGGGSPGGSGGEGPVDLTHLRALELRIQGARHEALKFSEIGKEQLADDVRYLYRLLQRAKGERATLTQTITALRGQLAREAGARAQLAEQARDRPVRAVPCEFRSPIFL